MDSILVNKLIQGVTLITPTRRLASSCQLKIETALSQTSKVFETPSVYSIEDWYKTRWDVIEMSGKSNERLLNPTQSLLAFENIITHSEWGATVLAPYQTAKIAFEAWKILNQWRSLDLLEKDYTQIDIITFNQWVKQYLDFLTKNAYFDYAMLPQKIFDYLITQTENALIFYGFEEKTPFLSYHVEMLKNKGWDILWKEPAPILPQTCERLAFLDEEKEHLAAVAFAKKRQQEGKQSIAIVVPQLADYRQKLEKLLKNAFDPLEICSPISSINPHFNISAAVPLVNYPLVNIALLGLRLGLEDFTVKDYQKLLHSPWLHLDETKKRHAHYIDIKRWHRGKLTIENVLHYLERHLDSANDWKKRLETLKNDKKQWPHQAPFHYWASVFRQCLQTLNWPANQALSSTEYQVVVRFETLLKELSECDAVLEETSYLNALLTLQKLASYIPFQPENKGAPVQVLGILEAAGQQFDALWVMGMQSEAWPPSANHNPFISLEEQKRRDMPHASADREMSYAFHMTERFKCSAKEVRFSYATQNKERKFEVSELIRDLPLALDSFSNNVQETVISSAPSLEYIDDNKAPILEEVQTFSAPSRLLELQSVCPFKAFAEYRLGAMASNEQSIWLQPSEQGSILHTILEKWWKIHPTQQSLLTMSVLEREKTIDAFIQQALQKYYSTKTATTHFEVEASRLRIILNDYFELELGRPPFSVVHTEYRKTFTLGTLNFAIRCDRIDQDDKQQKSIIDYKTGKFALSDWEGERLASPQMPLYALAYNDATLTSVMIIHLQLENCEYIGYTSTDSHIKGLKHKENFEEIKQRWHVDLEALANAFVNGEAKVSPRNKAVCQYCHLQALCRIKEKEAFDDL